MSKTTPKHFEDLHNELITHQGSKIFEKIYNILNGKRRRIVARACFKMIAKLEGGAFVSATLRKLMSRDYKISIGCHTYGEAFVPGAFAPSVTIGKYTSIAKGVKVFTQNHPTDELSTHPYFYEQQFKLTKNDTLKPGYTTIGHDVWIGQDAILLPGCQNVGHGAIIGAGAIVTKNVPDYAIVAGNPAKVIKYRFEKDTIHALLQLKWWDKSKSELNKLDYQRPEQIINFSVDKK